MIHKIAGSSVKAVPKVLVVDDEPDVLFVLEQLLKREGLTVLTATSGESALEVIKGEPVGLVLLDITMRGIDGLSTLREIKKIAPSLMTVMITGNSSSEKIVEAFNSGAYDYMIKPLDLHSLRAEVISKLLQ